jgi:hypothetical protein
LGYERDITVSLKTRRDFIICVDLIGVYLLHFESVYLFFSLIVRFYVYVYLSIQKK